MAAIQNNAPGAPASAAVIKASLTKINESVKLALAHQKPWSEVFDRTSFAKPESLADATNRVKKNLSYFKVNYAVVLFSVVVLSMLMSPISIFWLILLGLLWIYVFMIRTDPLIIMGRTLSEREKFLGLSAITVLITFGLTSVGSILISGVIVGAATVLVHAALRVPDDLFLDEQDSGIFLSFLGPSTSTLPPSIAHV